MCGKYFRLTSGSCPQQGREICKISFKFPDLFLKDVALVSRLGVNHVSVGRLANGGIDWLFHAKGVILKHEASETVLGLGTGNRCTLLYAFLDSVLVLFRNELLPVASSSDSLLWHRPVAHLNFRNPCILYLHVLDLHKLEQTKDICHPRPLGKAQELLVHGELSGAKEIGDITHSDLVNPLNQSHPGRFKYFVAFLDDCSRNNFVGMKRRSNDLNDIFKMFLERFSRARKERSGILQTAKRPVVRRYRLFHQNISFR